MNARLKPLAPPVSRPTYDNTNLSFRDWWVVDNATKLFDYWQACPGDASDDFEGFVWCQWDREMSLRDENRHTAESFDGAF